MNQTAAPPAANLSAPLPDSGPTATLPVLPLTVSKPGW